MKMASLEVSPGSVLDKYPSLSSSVSLPSFPPVSSFSFSFFSFSFFSFSFSFSFFFFFFSSPSYSFSPSSFSPSSFSSSTAARRGRRGGGDEKKIC